MFSDVSEYTDFVVSFIEKRQGLLDRQSMLDVVKFCTESFDSLSAARDTHMRAAESRINVSTQCLLAPVGRGCFESQSVPEASSEPVLGSGFESGGGVESSAGRGRGLVGVVSGSYGGPPRGPNFLRNQESRMRKKIAKEEKKRIALQGSWRKDDREDPDAELAQQVRRMRLERQKIQEQRKLDKLRSPTQMIEDAMRQVALAEKYAKLANDSKVAEWAANLSSASAESIAKSAGSSFTGSRVETVNTEYTSPSVKKDRFSVSYFALTSAERVVVDNRAIRVDRIEEIRRQYGRPLNYGDFMKSNFPHKLDASVRQLLRLAEEDELNNLVGY